MNGLASGERNTYYYAVATTTTIVGSVFRSFSSKGHRSTTFNRPVRRKAYNTEFGQRLTTFNHAD